MREGRYRNGKTNEIYYMNIKSQAHIHIQQQRGEKRKESPNKAS